MFIETSPFGIVFFSMVRVLLALLAAALATAAHAAPLSFSNQTVLPRCGPPGSKMTPLLYHQMGKQFHAPVRKQSTSLLRAADELEQASLITMEGVWQVWLGSRLEILVI